MTVLVTSTLIKPVIAHSIHTHTDKPVCLGSDYYRRTLDTLTIPIKLKPQFFTNG